MEEMEIPNCSDVAGDAGKALQGIFEGYCNRDTFSSFPTTVFTHWFQRGPHVRPMPFGASVLHFWKRLSGGVKSRNEKTACAHIFQCLPPQHFLNFLPLPHVHGSLRPTCSPVLLMGGGPTSLRISFVFFAASIVSSSGARSAAFSIDRPDNLATTLSMRSGGNPASASPRPNSCSASPDISRTSSPSSLPRSFNRCMSVASISVVSPGGSFPAHRFLISAARISGLIKSADGASILFPIRVRRGNLLCLRIYPLYYARQR